MKEHMKMLFAAEVAKLREEMQQKLEEATSTTAMLQKHVENLKRSNAKLLKKCDDNETFVLTHKRSTEKVKRKC